MAACPCGCHRSIRLMKKRIALHAHDLIVSYPIWNRLFEINPQDREKLRSTFSAHVAIITDCLLDVAHGEKNSFGWPQYVPSPAEVHKAQMLSNTAAQLVNASDAGFLSCYTQKLNPQDARLVKSMLTGPSLAHALGAAAGKTRTPEHRPGIGAVAQEPEPRPRSVTHLPEPTRQASTGTAQARR
jgi:hypothetical protein